MGYRDDFYVAENIVGYSGNITAEPSVYFQAQSGGRIEFGRITQDHDHKLNIGRNRTRKKADYVIENRLIDGETRCIEFYDGDIKHKSRSVFTPIGDCTPLQVSILKRAIFNFPEAKGKETATRAAKKADRASPTRDARRVIGKGGVANLLAQHEDAIHDAQN